MQTQSELTQSWLNEHKSVVQDPETQSFMTEFKSTEFRFDSEFVDPPVKQTQFDVCFSEGRLTEDSLFLT